jgi:hypothetical protein
LSQFSLSQFYALLEPVVQANKQVEVEPVVQANEQVGEVVQADEQVNEVQYQAQPIEGRKRVVLDAPSIDPQEESIKLFL